MKNCIIYYAGTGKTYNLKKCYTHYVRKSNNFCCEEFKTAWDDGYLGFGEHDTSLNVDKRVNIRKCFPYSEGACWDQLPIKFCPFCRSKIKLVQLGKVIKN